MNKVFTFLKSFLIGLILSFFVFLNNAKASVYITEQEPKKISELQGVFANVMISVWALTIPYFLFIIISIGAEYMLSFGDETKTASLKRRGGNIFLSFGMVFGGYIVVKLLLSLMGYRSPTGVDCFTDGTSVVDPFFQIFFPEVCSASV